MNEKSVNTPLGEPVPNWTPRPRPTRAALIGAWCTLEPLDVERHARALHAAFAQDVDGVGWAYLPYGPFPDAEAYAAWMRTPALGADPQFFAVVDRSGAVVGIVAYLRIEPAHGAIEIGHIHWSPALQRTPTATEAIFLLIDHAFSLGYRRVEWKCDSRNAPSRAAAQRFGFTFEGEFRRHMVVKGRNRDTAWYALIEEDWPPLRAQYVRWLAAANFDEHGRQRTRLRSTDSHPSA
jgi:RimJ/RimL family protein N-acetyltransferase